MNSRIFLVWKADPNQGEYIPIGQLDFSGKFYKFRYVAGIYRALESGFSIIPEFPEIEKEYKSEHLFPLFRNRLMDRARRNISTYLEGMALRESDDAIYELARSSGGKVTDRYRIVSMPQRENGRMELVFFAVGLSHEPVSNNLDVKLRDLEEGQTLLLTPQVQNMFDKNAIMIHTEKNEQVGWVPRFYSSEINELLRLEPDSINCKVLKINYPLDRFAPDILLVKISAKWPKNWTPFQTGEYLPATKEKSLNFA